MGIACNWGQMQRSHPEPWDIFQVIPGVISGKQINANRKDNYVKGNLIVRKNTKNGSGQDVEKNAKIGLKE